MLRHVPYQIQPKKGKSHEEERFGFVGVAGGTLFRVQRVVGGGAPEVGRDL